MLPIELADLGAPMVSGLASNPLQTAVLQQAAESRIATPTLTNLGMNTEAISRNTQLGCLCDEYMYGIGLSVANCMDAIYHGC